MQLQYFRVIPRPLYEQTLLRALGRNPVVALIGPRQCGKTTLALQILPPDNINYFDLEDPLVAGLMENSKTLLEGLKGLVVIDEAQREPRLFPVLRVLADRPQNPATFLILDSASPELSRQSGESLAGRVEIIEMQGLNLSETGPQSADTICLRRSWKKLVR